MPACCLHGLCCQEYTGLELGVKRELSKRWVPWLRRCMDMLFSVMSPGQQAGKEYEYMLLELKSSIKN